MLGSWVRAPAGSLEHLLKVLSLSSVSILKSLKTYALNLYSVICEFARVSGPGGEIGRHAILRGWWPYGRAGSSPVLGTKFFYKMPDAKVLVSYPVPFWLQRFFRILTFISSNLASFFALKIFFRPIPFPIPNREEKIRSMAVSSELILTSRNKKFDFFVFGDNPTKKLLFIHGWSGRGSQFYSLIQSLSEKGFQCCFFDAPGHGRNKDNFSDLTIFIETIHQLDRMYGPFELIVGHSLGGMAALNAFHNGLLTKGIITICSPSSIEGTVIDFTRAIGAGEKLVPHIIDRIEKKYQRKTRDFSPTSFMSNYNLPGLVIQDRDDFEVPMRHAVELSAEWKSAKCIYTEGLGHRKVLSDPLVLEEIGQFILSLCRH
jgi:esterase/lipase